MGLGRFDSFGVLKSPSVYRLQDVSGLDRSDSFVVLTSPSICPLQSVSGPRSVRVFPWADKSLCLPSPGSECASVDRILSVS